MKALLILSLLAAPVAAQRPCLTQGEAESIALVALPEIIRQTGATCTALPATSLVRQPDSAMLRRYDGEADRAWPAARQAVVKLSNATADALLQSEFARPLLTTLLVPLIVGRIAAKDCGTIDRLVTALEPLPPRNTAAIVLTTLQYLAAQKQAGNPVAGLPLCVVR